MAVVAPRTTIEMASSIIIMFIILWQGVHDSLNSVKGEMAKRANFNCFVIHFPA